jgi:hypothetical protein
MGLCSSSTAPPSAQDAVSGSLSSPSLSTTNSAAGGDAGARCKGGKKEKPPADARPTLPAFRVQGHLRIPHFNYSSVAVEGGMASDEGSLDTVILTEPQRFARKVDDIMDGADVYICDGCRVRTRVKRCGSVVGWWAVGDGVGWELGVARVCCRVQSS